MIHEWDMLFIIKDDPGGDGGGEDPPDPDPDPPPDGG